MTLLAKMSLLLALLVAGFSTGCVSTWVAVDVPATSPVRSARDLSGRYANHGLCHSPTESHVFEDWLEVALGLSDFHSARGDTLAIKAEEETLTFTSFGSGRILREKILKKDRDYRLTESGVELVRRSVGSGGESSLISEVTTRIIIALAPDGRLIVRSLAVGTGMDGLHKSALESWYEFKKEG